MRVYKELDDIKITMTQLHTMRSALQNCCYWMRSDLEGCSEYSDYMIKYYEELKQMDTSALIAEYD